MHRFERRQGDDGFTLIELLVVIIIIGILAAVAIPVFLSQRGRAKTATVQADLRAAAVKLTVWNTDNPSFATVPFGTGTGSGQSITGAGQTVGGETMTLSPNNTVTLEAAGPSGYCLSAVNASNPAKLYYDSTGGGLTTQICAAKLYS